MYLETNFKPTNLVTQQQQQQQRQNNCSPTFNQYPQMNKAWTPYSSRPEESEIPTFREERDQEREMRSQTIPMPRTHVPRTNSEVQLREDMAAAEWRDLCMFYRVVNGIRERQLSNSPGFEEEGGDNGVKIATHHESLEDIAAQYKHPDDMTNVTPYESGNDVSPYSQCFQRQSGFLSQQPSHDVEGDGWSISGYEELEAPMIDSAAAAAQLIAVVEDDDEEEDMFSMEL